MFSFGGNSESSPRRQNPQDSLTNKSLGGSASVTLGEARSVTPVTIPKPSGVCAIAAMLQRPAPIDLSHIPVEAFRHCVDKCVRGTFVKPSKRCLAQLVAATHGRIADWGIEEEVAFGLKVALQRALTSESWAAAMRASITMHVLLWEGGPEFIDAAHRMDPPPSSCMLQKYDNNMCGQGTKQRPVVAFIAGMLNFLLQLMTSISLTDIVLINKKGFKPPRMNYSSPVPITEATARRSDAPSDLLMRCVMMQSYLTYLLSATDLPLLAMDNEISVEVLDHVIADAKSIYACIVQHLEHLLDPRYHAVHAVSLQDVAAWKSLMRGFANTCDRLANFFSRLNDINVGLSETMPELVPFKHDEAGTRLEQMVKRHAPLVPTVNQQVQAAEAHLRPMPSPDVERSSPTNTEGGSLCETEDNYPDSASSRSTVGLTLPFARAPLVDTFKDGQLTDAGDENDTSERDTTSGELPQSFDSATAQRYLLGNVLGKGAYGTVYRAFDTELGHFVAVKELQLKGSVESSMEPLEELRKEFNLLTKANDPNVVSVFALDICPDVSPRIVMEWMPGGSVQSALKLTKRGFKETVVARYVRQALSGLAFLHRNNIVHRDIKPANMLLSATGEVKLSDFGTSRMLSEAQGTMQTGTVVGTIPYLAPECFKGYYSPASDVWAIGCSALEMLTSAMPWSEKNCRDTISLVFVIGNAAPPNHHPQLPEITSNDVSPLVPCSVGGLSCGQGTITEVTHDFLMKCFTYDYKTRPSAAELLKHPFVTNAA